MDGVPARRDWAVARPRVAERFDEGARGPLTVVTGPPGAGKSVAAAMWAASGAPPGPVAWASLDREDHRSAAFWTIVLAALDDAGVAGLPAVPGPSGRGRESFLTALASVLGGAGAPVVLVLDDFRPPSGSSVARDLARVLTAAGPALRLVLISRGDPPLPLHRHRLTGDLTEIRGGDLAFDEQETRALLDRHGVRVTAPSLRALEANTEGWAAGLRLAALAMRGHPDPDGFAAEFGGDDPAALDYLVAEGLNAQPARIRGLLLDLGVARRFNADLAAELAGREAGGLFADLVRRNAFVVPLGRGWYRFHAMFAEALDLTSRHERPGGAVLLHRRAAAWFARNRLPEDAVRHAVLAGDWSRACRLVVGDLAVGRLLGLTGDRAQFCSGGCGGSSPHRELARLMAGMPDPAGSAAPETAVVAAATALAQGDHRVCAHRLAHAERHLAALPDDRAVPARLAAVLVRVVAALPCPDGAFHGLVRELDLLLEALPRGRTDGRPELRALVRHGYALMDLRAGRPRQAAAGLRLALPAAEAGADLQLRRCVGDLALAEALQGRFGRAADLVARAERLPEVPADPGGCPVPAVHLAGAWVAFEDVRLDDARAELGKVRQAAGRPPDGLISVLRALLTARLDLASGRPGQALAVLYSAQEEAAGMPWLRRLLLLVAAEAQAATGAVGAAMESARAAGGAAGAITLARIQLGLGEAAAAARTVRPAVVESTAVPADVRVEAWLLDACLAYRAGDGSKGRRSLEHALRLGERERISLPFAQARNWLFPVLRGDPALLGAHRALIGPLGAAAGAGTRPDADPGGSGGSGEAPMAFGRLSARELQVLGLLSEMLTTEEIATEMCVSVNTVKTHLRSIYRKLAVTRRGEAVRRAHHLDLL